MPTYRYTGNLTNFQGYEFPANAHVELTVKPVRDAFRSQGLAAAKTITVPVGEGGAFEVWLEASDAVHPRAVYVFQAEWFEDYAGVPEGRRTVGWAQWWFVAPVGGGNIGELGAVNVGIDTDGVPFYDPGNWVNQVLLDTDGTPYIQIGR